MRRVSVIAALMAALLALSGCYTAYPDAFYRAQTTGDVLDIDFEALRVEPGSLRFLADEAGLRYFVGQGVDAPLCLVHLSPSDLESAGAMCGDSGMALQAGSGPKVELVVPDMGERPGWRKLAPNLYAEED